MRDLGMSNFPWRTFSSGGFRQPVGQPANLRRLPPRYLPGPKADREFRIGRSFQDATMVWIAFKGWSPRSMDYSSPEVFMICS